MTGTRWFSLRRRLLVWLLTGVTVSWLGAMGYAWFEARHELEELFEEHHDGDEEHVRHELAEHFLVTLFTPLAVGLPLLGAWIWFATRQGMKPLDGLAAEIAARAPERLDPLVPRAAPREIRPLIEALNGLFSRVAASLEAERRFTSDAAHELRTPLAAILAQAQVAQRARDAAERDHALAQIQAGSERARRLIDQLLTLARLDPAENLPKEHLQLDRLAAEVCAEHGPLALEKAIALELEAPREVFVDGSADLLRILLRNLLDNALRYTPAGGRVWVKVGAGPTAAELAVADDGPGIPAEERHNVLRRFYRLAGQDVAGSGLGLSIVARIAELHGARLLLEDNQPGLKVRVEF
ncbi:MAG: ATP-binding protein [Rhodocyclaceae bacterium]|nr:ATP-binding protein [Rhodocyclaceae bacterium]